MLIAFFVLMSLAILIAWYVKWQFYGFWLMAHTSGAPITYLELIGLKLRKSDVRLIVFNYVRCVKADLNISLAALETHHLARGDVTHVVSALIAAKGAGLPLTWQEATALQLKGDDVLSAVETSARLKQAAPVQG